MFSRTYWKDVAERAVRAAAGSLVGLWSVHAGLNLLALDWKTALGVSGGAALFSFVTSLVGGKIGDPTTGSLLLGPPGRHELRK